MSRIKWVLEEIPAQARDSVKTLTTLVAVVIESLVEHPDDAVVCVQANHRRVMFTVHVAEDDVGLALGTQGRHADALRTLLVAASRKLKMHFDLDIGGPTGDPDWSSN